MKNILLPTDFSENAQVAANFTVNLFRGLPVNLQLYNFYGLHHSTGSMLISIDDLLQKDAQTAMNAEVKRISEYSGDEVVLKAKNLNGKLTDFMQEIISNNSIDLIAMGTRGSSGIREDLFGSNTTHVLNTVKAPVLVIPHNSPIKELVKPKIAFATDFKSFGTESQLRSFIELLNAKYGSCEKEVVYVSEQQDEIEPGQREFCTSLLGTDINEFVNIEDKSVHQGLMQYLDASQPDILIMIHRKNSFIDRLLRTSLSTKMALNSGTPLLIFKD